MLKKLIKFLFGCTINVFEVKSGDTVIFEVNWDYTKQDAEDFINVMGKFLKVNIAVVRDIHLDSVVRNDVEE